MVEAFLSVAAIGFLGMFTEFGTVYAFAALLPVLLVWKAFKMADEWMIKWNNPDADRQKVPYELLLVNVSTIGIHFLTGILTFCCLHTLDCLSLLISQKYTDSMMA